MLVLNCIHILDTCSYYTHILFQGMILQMHRIANIDGTPTPGAQLIF